jgi:hypothetical protein
VGVLPSPLRGSWPSGEVMGEAELLLALMVAVVGLSVLARVIEVPCPILLVLGFVPGMPHIELPPELVLVLFLPPLLHRSASTPPWWTPTSATQPPAPLGRSRCLPTLAKATPAATSLPRCTTKAAGPVRVTGEVGGDLAAAGAEWPPQPIEACECHRPPPAGGSSVAVQRRSASSRRAPRCRYVQVVDHSGTRPGPAAPAPGAAPTYCRTGARPGPGAGAVWSAESGEELAQVADE